MALRGAPSRRTALISTPEGPHLNIYINALKPPEFGSIAVVDATGSVVDRARAAIGNDRVKPFSTTSEMIARLRPSLAVVALEAHQAPAAILPIVEAGIDTLAEKPACVRASDFARLRTIADQKQRRLMLAFANRFHPAFARARELLREGAIGDFYGLDMHYIADQTRLKNPKYQQSWFAFPEKAGGGHLIWLGIHYLDLAAFITGRRIEMVTALTANTGGQPIQVEDSAAVSFRFAGGGLGSLHSAYYLPKGYDSTIRIWGSRGSLAIDPAKPAVSLMGTENRTEQFSPADSYGMLVRAAAGLADGAVLPTAGDSLHALETVFACYESARTGRTITLPA